MRRRRRAGGTEPVRPQALLTFGSLSLVHGLEGFRAGALAAPAGLGADFAVFVMLRMLLALFRAEAAGRAASLDDRRQDLFIRARAARGHGAGRNADIGAVKIEPDALLELLNVVLGEAGVCAGRAGLRARVTFLDTAQQRVGVFAPNIGMGMDHLLYVHIVSPSVEICRAAND